MRRTSIIAVIAATASLLGSLSVSAQIPLGTAQSFAVLGGSTVTNTGPTVVTGSLGVSPGSSVTGFPPGVVIGGTIHAADAVAAQAQSAVTIAYNTAAGLPCGTDLTGQDLGGLILTPDVYCFSSSAALTGTLTLDMQGDPNAQFVFQIGSTLTTASGSSVVTVNNGGANCPANLFWQVGSSAVLGSGSTFAGNILALTSITLNTAASTNGRLLARNGAVTLDSNTVTLCAAVPGGPGSTGIPALGFAGLTMLALLLGATALFVMNRMGA
jgi:hypothetical protein